MANTNESERKTKPLKIRLTPETYKRLEALAAQGGQTLGGWIADTINASRKPRMDRRTVRAELSEARRLAAGSR